MKPRWKSVWIRPAHSGAVEPAQNVHARRLLVAGREERAQPEQVVGAADHAEQRALAEAEALEHLGPLGRVVDRRGLGLELHAHADHLDVVAGVVELGGDLGLDRGDRVELVLADVDDGEHRRLVSRKYGREQRRAGRPSGRRGRAGGRRESAALAALQRVELVAERLVELGLALRPGRAASRPSRGRRGRARSRRRAGARAGRTGPATSSSSNARSTNTMASTSRMLARNLLPRPSPLLAPSTRPPMSTTCTAACTTLRLLRHRGQPVEALVGHLGDADVGVLGGEGVRRGERAAAGEGVVQRALARVGEADQAEAFHDGAQATADRPRPSSAAARSVPIGRRTAWSIGMTPVEALDRVVHCLDRAHEAGFKAKAFVRARDVVRDLPPEEIERAGRRRHAHRARRHRRVDGAGDHRGARRRRAVVPRQARGRDPGADHRRGRGATARRCAATATPTPRGATAGRRSRRWPRTAMRARPRVHGAHRPLARLTIAHGLDRERLLQQLDDVAALNERLDAVPHPHRHGGRHPRGRLARPRRRPARPPRRRRRQRALEAADGRASR